MKKASGKHYVSKGERANVDSLVCKQVRKSVSYLDKKLRYLEAFLKGKKVLLKNLSDSERNGTKGFVFPKPVTD